MLSSGDLTTRERITEEGGGDDSGPRAKVPLLEASSTYFEILLLEVSN